MNIYNKEEMDRLEKSRLEVECGGDEELYREYFKKCDNCGLRWETNKLFSIHRQNTVIVCDICMVTIIGEHESRNQGWTRRMYESD